MSSGSGMIFNQVQNEIQNVLIKLIPHSSSTGSLSFSAHLDGHTVGSTSYDDAIHCCVLMDLLPHFSEENIKLYDTIQFLLLESEEMGNSLILSFN
jgi:hypothetical protein